MGKPLLTDEILEKANRQEKYPPYHDTEIGGDDFQGYEEGQTIFIPVEPSIVKSRRIETLKRDVFRSKVNKILFWVVLLVAALIGAVLFI